MSDSHPDLARQLGETQVIVDVRTPAEFAKGHISGALNIPLFSDGERAEIGTLYKQIGRGQAIDRGLDLVGGRLREFAAAFDPYRKQRLLVYCARGGMRSASVVSLLASIGHAVEQLPGGYKAFRNYLLAGIDRAVPAHPIVIHGQTGVGKTRLIERLPNALDLEDLAQHRSSLFGAVNRQPRTQQQFEAELLRALEGLDPVAPVFIEGESRKVGSAIIPRALMAAMKGGTCVLVTASLDTRVRRIIDEYSDASPETLPQLIAALRTLAPLFGRSEVAELEARLLAGEMAAVVETLLTGYYDPRYRHAMRHYEYACTLSAEDLDACAASLRAFAPEVAARSALPAAHSA